ncbi:MAG: glycosyltransferase family 2 protein, partial [Candidatus Uhrbacteria bacterium]|nr:glycosyltransferase family 2 protein [Candidatus Uhrbacteria bacterium]
MATESQEDLAVIIVSWNVKDAVLENLRSVFASEPMPALDVILVDNASEDGTAEAVREAFPDVRVIANEANRGFAAACNQGLAASSARHALLLNPDMRVEPGALAKTIDYLDAYPNVAVLGAKLVGEDPPTSQAKYGGRSGKPMHHLRRFPT